MIRAAYASWSSILGTTLACVALTSLIFRLLETSVADLLEWLLLAYRQTFYPPIDFLLSWLPFGIPAVGKDFLVVYCAGAGILFRTLSFGLPANVPELPTSVTMRFRMLYGRIFAALTWPWSLRFFLRRPSYVIRTGDKFNGRLPTSSRHVAEMALEFMPGSEIVCTDRDLIGVYFVTLISAVVGLLILNAALDRLVS